MLPGYLVNTIAADPQDAWPKMIEQANKRLILIRKEVSA
jgi:hypothetical protein